MPLFVVSMLNRQIQASTYYTGWHIRHNAQGKANQMRSRRTCCACSVRDVNLCIPNHTIYIVSSNATNGIYCIGWGGEVWVWGRRVSNGEIKVLRDRLLAIFYLVRVVYFRDKSSEWGRIYVFDGREV